MQGLLVRQVSAAQGQELRAVSGESVGSQRGVQETVGWAQGDMNQPRWDRQLVTDAEHFICVFQGWLFGPRKAGEEGIAQCGAQAGPGALGPVSETQLCHGSWLLQEMFHCRTTRQELDGKSLRPRAGPPLSHTC